MMLLRGIDGGIRNVENMSAAEQAHQQQQQVSSKIVEDLIEMLIGGTEHFANEDAILLAEAYHSRVGNERSLLVLAHCLTRTRSFENAYHLLKTLGNPTSGAGLKTAKCRYLFAYCAYTLNRLQEAENTLRDESVHPDLALHPAFNGTPTRPFAHSLLAKILCETNRVESARFHWARAIGHNATLWSSVRAYCEVGGTVVRDQLQPFLDELAHWRSTTNTTSPNTATDGGGNAASDKSSSGGITGGGSANTAKGANKKGNKKGGSSARSSIAGSVEDLVDKEDKDNAAAGGEDADEDVDMDMVISGGGGGGRATPITRRTPSRTRAARRIGGGTSTTSTPNTAESKRRTRLRNIGTTDVRFNPTAAAPALRASENSPRAGSKISTGTGGGAPLIMDQQQKLVDDKEEQQQQLLMSTKRTTRRTAALAAAAAKAEAASKEAESEMNKLFQKQVHQDQQIYYELLDWLLQLAFVQEQLSRFRCVDALKLLDKLNPTLSQLPLSLELRARIFFENGEYKRACEIFEEIRRLYPRRVQGMEIYSTALWQLHDPKKLSALAAEMADVARDQPQTWCIAGNCFSLEKQHETAIECLERSVRLDHRFGYAYSLLGHELIDMNDLARAEQAFRKAIVHAPNDYRAWYGLGLVHYKEEKLELSRVNMQRAVQINPTNTVLLCQLAVIEQAMHRNESAMRWLQRALKHQPNNVPCRFHKARLLFDTGHYEQAKAELEELKVLSPDEANVFFLLGRVNRKLGNTHMALLNFSWATEIDPRGEQNQSAQTTDKGPYDDEPLDT